jgi:hypothetical protein
MTSDSRINRMPGNAKSFCYATKLVAAAFTVSYCFGQW